jgi:hypothetical protein
MKSKGLILIPALIVRLFGFLSMRQTLEDRQLSATSAHSQRYDFPALFFIVLNSY